MSLSIMGVASPPSTHPLASCPRETEDFVFFVGVAGVEGSSENSKSLVLAKVEPASAPRIV